MRSKLKVYSFIIIIGIIISIPLFNSKYNIYIDDGIQHICRIMGTYQSIAEGQTFPVIMSNFCNGFGYSWNLFYSPATAYIPLIFHFITNSFVADIKIFMVIITILTGIAMFEFLFSITKNRYTSLLGATIYMLAPYRLTDMYIRMALAELTSFIFLPMIFQGLHMIFYEQKIDSKKPQIILIIGVVGLILTHLVISIYTAIIALVYVLIHIKNLKNKNILKRLFISFVFIVCITSFFLLPMLEQKMNTDYEVFKPGRMERTDVLIYHKLNLLDFICTQKGGMVFEIGLVTIVGLFLTIVAYKKIDKSYRKTYIYAFIIGITSLIMSLKYFPFEKLPAILKMLQFSFRMLEFSSFFLAIIVSINFTVLIKNFERKDVIALTGIMVLLTVPIMVRNIPYNENLIKESALWPAVSVNEKTKRVHAGCASFEYLPSKAFENLDYIKTRENKVYVLDGQVDIEDEIKNGTNMRFKIENMKQKNGDIANEESKYESAEIKLELPYIYYSGYEVMLETDETKMFLQIRESDNGFLQISLPENIEKGEIIVSYPGTNVIKVSMVISILGFSSMILYSCWRRKKT